MGLVERIYPSLTFLALRRWGGSRRASVRPVGAAGTPRRSQSRCSSRVSWCLRGDVVDESPAGERRAPRRRGWSDVAELEAAQV